MKILIDARLYGLENAGLGRYSMNLVDNLSKLDSKNEYVILLRKKYFESLTLPDNWKKVLADFQHYSFSEQIQIPQIIKKENPDISHFLHFNVPLMGVGKYIVTIHDLLMHKNRGFDSTTLPAPVYLIKRLGYKTIFKNAVIKASKIIVPTNSVKNELVEYYKLNKNKVEVIYEGLDEKISSGVGLNTQKPYFVYTGNAYPHKNLKRLVEAILLLNKNSDKKITLAIASSRNVFTDRLQNLIDKLNANEFVKLLGFVPDSELGGFYKNSEGFVFPSLSEGFGLPGLEAMSFGTLALVSDIPVFKEVYKDNAIYFNPLDFTSITNAMENVLSLDKTDREERVNKSKRLLSSYSWPKMAKETLDIYKLI